MKTLLMWAGLAAFAFLCAIYLTATSPDAQRRMRDKDELAQCREMVADELTPVETRRELRRGCNQMEARMKARERR